MNKIDQITDYEYCANRDEISWLKYDGLSDEEILSFLNVIESDSYIYRVCKSEYDVRCDCIVSRSNYYYD